MVKVEGDTCGSGLKVMPGDEAFYYLYEDGKLLGALLTHVDNLILAGNKEFIEGIREGMTMVLTVSVIERDRFRFTG